MILSLPVTATSERSQITEILFCVGQDKVSDVTKKVVRRLDGILDDTVTGTDSVTAIDQVKGSGLTEKVD